MSAPPPSSEWTATPPSHKTAARPGPVSKWVWFVLLALLLVSRCRGHDGQSILRGVDELPLLIRLLGGGLLAMGLGQWLRGVYRWRLSKQRPLEPWLWDHPWRQELLGSSLAERALQLFMDLFFPGLLLAFFLTCAVFFLKRPSPLGFSVIGLLVCIPLVLIRDQLKHHVPRIRSTRRFGRLQLHLPQIPLILGSHCQARLSAQHGLAGLTHLQVELERVVELDFKKLYTGYTHKDEVDVSLLREGTELPLELVLPQEGPDSSTVLHGPTRSLWLLRLKGSTPDVDLDVRFVLPVYFAEG